MAAAQPQSQPGPGGGLPSRAAPGIRPPLSATERVLAVFTYFLTVYRRTWRGSIIGRFLSPLFFLLAMGIGLGSLVDDRVGGVGGLPYLQFVVPAIVATCTRAANQAEVGLALWLLIRAAKVETDAAHGAIR